VPHNELLKNAAFSTTYLKCLIIIGCEPKLFLKSEVE